MSAHRDDLATCAACGEGLDARGARFVCGKCGGTLVTNAELEAMLKELSPDDARPLVARLGASTGSLTPRRCPRCATLMSMVSLYGVALDQCTAHGVWFDVDELAKVLNENGQAYAARNSSDAWDTSEDAANAAIDLGSGQPFDALLRWVFGSRWWNSKRTPKAPEPSSPKKPTS